MQNFQSIRLKSMSICLVHGCSLCASYEIWLPFFGRHKFYFSVNKIRIHSNLKVKIVNCTLIYLTISKCVFHLLTWFFALHFLMNMYAYAMHTFTQHRRLNQIVSNDLTERDFNLVLRVFLRSRFFPSTNKNHFDCPFWPNPKYLDLTLSSGWNVNFYKKKVFFCEYAKHQNVNV